MKNKPIVFRITLLSLGEAIATVVKITKQNPSFNAYKICGGAGLMTEIHGQLTEPLTASASNNLDGLVDEILRVCYPCEVMVHAHGPWTVRVEVRVNGVPVASDLFSERDLENISGRGSPFLGNIESIAQSILIRCRRR